MKHNLFFIFVSFVLLCGRFFLAAETQVSISVSDNLATIGDRIHLKLIVKTTSEVDKITLKAAEKEFEILEQKPTQIRKQQDYTVFEKAIDIAFFKTGDFNVGPFEIDLKKGEEVLESRETNSVPVTVKSVLKEEDKDIKPLKGLVDMRGNPLYMLNFVLGTLGVVLIIVLVILLIKNRNKKVEITREPLLSPLEELEQSIKKLYGKNLFEKGKMKLFFIELTEILKYFLHRTYQFNAEDLTTYETIYRLKQCETVPQLVNSMDFLFNTADLVKFAKFVPDAGVLGDVSGKLEDTAAIYKHRAAMEAQKLEEERKQRQTKEITPEKEKVS
ncbi:MAG: hypothetical protein GY950_22225 [bacterium]|nr:hypothetical protein [bacterium]